MTSSHDSKQERNDSNHSIDKGLSVLRRLGIPIGVVAMLGTSGYNVYTDKDALTEARNTAANATKAVERVESTVKDFSNRMDSLMGNMAKDVNNLQIELASIKASRFTAQDGNRAWEAIADLRKDVAVLSARTAPLPPVPTP